MIVVRRLAADIDHAVDRRRAAKHPAARKRQDAATEPRLGDSLKAPVGARIADAVDEPDGDFDPDIAVEPSSLDKQDADCRIGAETIGENTASRTGANDDVVETSEILHPASCEALMEQPLALGAQRQA